MKRELNQKTFDFTDNAKDQVNIARKAAAALNQNMFGFGDGVEGKGNVVRNTVVGGGAVTRGIGDRRGKR